MSLDVREAYSTMNQMCHYMGEARVDYGYEAEWLASSVLTDLRLPFSFPPPPMSDRSAALAVAELNNSGLDSSSRPPKKKKIRNEKKVLPRSDIRNTYANCYYNALNSGDEQVIRKVLNNICEPDVVLSHTFINREFNNFMPFYVEVVGIDAMATAGAAFVKAAPDVYFELLNQEIELFSDGEVIACAEYSMQGTKVMDLTGFPEEGEEKVVLSTSVNMDYDLAENFGKKLQVNATTLEYHLDPMTGMAMEMVQSIQRFGVDGISEYPTIIDVPIARTTFYMNPDKKIYKIVAVK